MHEPSVDISAKTSAHTHTHKHADTNTIKCVLNESKTCVGEYSHVSFNELHDKNRFLRHNTTNKYTCTSMMIQKHMCMCVFVKHMLGSLHMSLLAYAQDLSSVQGPSCCEIIIIHVCQHVRTCIYMLFCRCVSVAAFDSNVLK